MLKKCSSCQFELSENNFSPAEWNRESKQGRRCRSCIRIKNSKIDHEKKKQSLRNSYYKNYEKRRKEQKNYYNLNKKELLAKSKKYRDENAEKMYHYTWKRRIYKTYGLTIEDYEQLLKKQNYLCAICKSNDPGGNKTPRATKIVFAIDHCHITGKVRGLLCNKCNLALGLFKDDPEILKIALNYLQN